MERTVQSPRRTIQIPTYEGVVSGGQVRLLGAPPLPEGTRVYVTVVTGHPTVDMSEPTADELAYLATAGGSFEWLEDEPELYTDADLEERFEWSISESCGR